MKRLTASIRLLLISAPCLLLTSIASAGDPPRSMRHLVMNPKHRTAAPLVLGGAAWETIRISSDLPNLLWPVDKDAKPFERTREAARAFLEVNGQVLGVNGFELVFDHEGLWRRNVVWSYRIEREGLVLHDARIDVHWEGEHFAGVFNRMPGPVVAVEEFEQPPGAAVWFAQRATAGPRGAVQLVLARDTQEQLPGRTRRSLTALDGTTLTTIVTSTHPPLGGGTATSGGNQANAGPPIRVVPVWTEYPVPSGSFPDQISSDSSGKIWFSQPNNNKLSSLDPSTSTFAFVNTPGDIPDGMIVDSNDLVWSGSYSSGRGLVRVDALSGVLTRFPSPYGGALMAIPFEARNGSIWVTDHVGNRISEFNPGTTTWLNSYTLPTSSSWVVDPTEDTTNGDLYFTEFNINALLYRAPGQAPTNINLPVNSGPAFNRYSNGKVYVSLWSSARLLEYDIASGVSTQYNFPVAGESGGPLDLMSDGRVAIGTRNQGYVMLFNPQTQTFKSYKIPTPSPGLKDGLHVDALDNIWVTETQTGNKLARLQL